MFEIEQMENEFDYSLVDSDTADFLRSCEYEMNGIAEDARIKFGRVLKKAQDRLSRDRTGMFQKWFESGGLDKNDVYYSINLYELSTNLDSSKKDNFLIAPKSLQKEVMKQKAPEELKGKVFDGDITTHKQYKEMLKELEQEKKAKEQAEQQAKQAQQSEKIALKQLEEMEDKETEVVEKEVIKEVVPDDYNDIKENFHSIKGQQERYRKENEKLQKEIEKLNSEMNRKKAEVTDSDMKEKEKEVKLLQLDASKSVLKTKIEIDEFLQKVAVTSYRRGAIATSTDATKNKLKEGISDLQNFINEMEMALDGTIEQ